MAHNSSLGHIQKMLVYLISNADMYTSMCMCEKPLISATYFFKMNIITSINEANSKCLYTYTYICIYVYICIYIFIYLNILYTKCRNMCVHMYLSTCISTAKRKKKANNKSKALKRLQRKNFASGQSCRYQSSICWFIYVYRCVCVCVCNGVY